MSKIKQIVTGHINELFHIEEKLYSKRKPICNICKLKIEIEVMGIQTEICNPKLYLNVETNRTSEYPKEGYEKGCGCRVEASTRVKDKKCPLGKW
jgi:hypothetical protein